VLISRSTDAFIDLLNGLVCADHCWIWVAMALDGRTEYFQLGEINKKSNALQKEITAKKKVCSRYIHVPNDGARLTHELFIHGMTRQKRTQALFLNKRLHSTKNRRNSRRLWRMQKPQWRLKLQELGIWSTKMCLWAITRSALYNFMLGASFTHRGARRMTTLSFAAGHLSSTQTKRPMFHLNVCRIMKSCLGLVPLT
jgi:hypothetical protein